MSVKLELYEPEKEAEKVVRILPINFREGSVIVRGVREPHNKNLLELRPNGVYLCKNLDEELGLPLDSAGRLKLVGAPSVSTSLEMFNALKLLADELNPDSCARAGARVLISKARAEIDGKDVSE